MDKDLFLLEKAEEDVLDPSDDKGRLFSGVRHPRVGILRQLLF